MGFRKDAYASVWSVESISDVNTKCRISISRKNKQSGEYEQDFSGFVSFIGTAVAKKAACLTEGSRIKLGDVDVSTSYNSETKKSYTNFKVFSFELVEDGKKSDDSADPQTEVDGGEIDTEEQLPF